MKNLVVYFLLIAFFMQNTAKLFILINFKINQDQIAQTQCENRNKPEMGCEGCCCLKKQLKKQEKKENRLPSLLKEKIEYNIYIVKNKLPLYFQKNKSTQTFNYLVREVIGISNKIFHPPPFTT